MRRCLLFAAAALFLAPAQASEPGQPLDCSDWVFLEPGFSCSVFLTPPLPEQSFQTAWWTRGNNIATDNEGHLVIVQERSGGGSGSAFIDRIEIVRLVSSGEQVIGFVESRDGPLWRDRISPKDECSASCWGGSPRIAEGFTFDAVGGRLFLPLRSYCDGVGCPCGTSCHGAGYGGWWVAVISGFAPLLEIFQSYEPIARPLSFVVPAMPEGLPAADYFDTYYGDLATVGDWSQAQPLQCGYPATPPNVGDYLTVADPLPDPAPGTGRYYVTAVTHQGQRRFGRKSANGVLSGRDPAVLPGCE